LALCLGVVSLLLPPTLVKGVVLQLIDPHLLLRVSPCDIALAHAHARARAPPRIWSAPSNNHHHVFVLTHFLLPLASVYHRIIPSLTRPRRPLRVCWRLLRNLSAGEIALSPHPSPVPFNNRTWTSLPSRPHALTPSNNLSLRPLDFSVKNPFHRCHTGRWSTHFFQTRLLPPQPRPVFTLTCTAVPAL
jgi:hypothetical protein